jgi:cyanophycin synthetase
VLDLAHNEAGLEALLRVCRGLAAPTRRVLLGLGAVGDRPDEALEAMGDVAARGADVVAVVHKQRYLRGRQPDELETLLRRGAAAAGVHDVPVFDSELTGLQGLLAQAAPGDVVAVMVHADRVELDAWLRDQGATVDGPDDVRAKVVAARGLHPRESEIDLARALPDRESRLAALAGLHSAAPDDPRLAFEHAGALDGLGREADAVPLYREALEHGLAEPWRTRARVQLASSLRVLGDPAAALAELDAVLAEHPSTAATAFRALALHDLGRHGEALAVALTELSAHLAGGDAEPYAPAVAAYAAELRPR